MGSVVEALSPTSHFQLLIYKGCQNMMKGSLATTAALFLCLFLKISTSMRQQSVVMSQESLRGLIPIVKTHLAPDREKTLLISNLSSELIEMKDVFSASAAVSSVVATGSSSKTLSTPLSPSL